MLKQLLSISMLILYFGMPNSSGAQSILGEAKCIGGYCTEVGISRDWHVECTRQDKGMKWCIAAPWTKPHANPQAYEIAPLRVEVWQHEGEIQSHVKIDGAEPDRAMQLDVEGGRFSSPIRLSTESVGWKDDAAFEVIQAFKKGRRATYKAAFIEAIEVTNQASLMGFTVAWKAITTFIGQDPLRATKESVTQH